jgi:hypothetical protein
VNIYKKLILIQGGSRVTSNSIKEVFVLIHHVVHDKCKYNFLISFKNLKL